MSSLFRVNESIRALAERKVEGSSGGRIYPLELIYYFHVFVPLFSFFFDSPARSPVPIIFLPLLSSVRLPTRSSFCLPGVAFSLRHVATLAFAARARSYRLRTRRINQDTLADKGQLPRSPRKWSNLVCTLARAFRR